GRRGGFVVDRHRRRRRQHVHDHDGRGGRTARAGQRVGENVVADEGGRRLVLDFQAVDGNAAVGWRGHDGDRVEVAAVVGGDRNGDGLRRLGRGFIVDGDR